MLLMILVVVVSASSGALAPESNGLGVECLNLKGSSSGEHDAVPPPTNVTLSCQNLKTTVSWKYNEQETQTNFRVQIFSPEPCVINTTAHQYDLSPFIWKSHQNYMGYHYVNVTAVQGDKESHPVMSNSLTFNSNTPAGTKCYLDFPPVTVTSRASQISVSFNNPFNFYEDLKKAKKPDNTLFTFSDVSNHKYFTAECKWNDNICRYDFLSPNDTEVCVTLRGELSGGNHVETVVFRQTEVICPTETYTYVTTLAVLLSALPVLVGVITCVACKVCGQKDNWQTKTPTSLIFPEKPNCKPQKEDQEEKCVVHFQLVPSEDSSSSTLPNDDSCSYSDNTSDLYMTKDSGLMSEFSMETESSSIEGEEEEQEEQCVGVYEARQVIQDLGDRDMIHGYRR